MTDKLQAGDAMGAAVCHIPIGKNKNRLAKICKIAYIAYMLYILHGIEALTHIRRKYEKRECQYLMQRKGINRQKVVGYANENPI